MGRSRLRPGHHGVKARRSLIGLLLTACLVTGCTYSKVEPGLFGRSPEPTTVAPAPGTPEQSTPAPPPINPDLPVVGEAIWTSADGLDIQVRIAVHAVRRITGGSVLDWSVTPLRGRRLRVGDAVPASLNLGLSRFGEGNANVFLVDADNRRVYRPLTATGQGDVQNCLCSPIWVAQRTLRIGQTRLLQIAYPELPADIATIDVDVATVPQFAHVPITPVGMVPQAITETDLTRAADVLSVGASTRVFRYPPARQRFLISVDEVIGSSTFTSIQWTIQSLTEGDGLESASMPPLAEPDPNPIKNYNPFSATGPRIVPSGEPKAAPLRTRLVTTKLRGLGGLECLCSDFRSWAIALRLPQEQASVITNLPPLPNGVQQVDVILPGLAELKGLPVTEAADATFRSAGPIKKKSGSWTYHLSDPPAGWPVNAWPTPLPTADQVSRYQKTVDDLVR